MIGPQFAIWHIDGHGHEIQALWLAMGLPIEPTIRLPWGTGLDSTTSLTSVAQYIEQYNGKTVSLRMNNLHNMIEDRVGFVDPINEDTIPDAWHVVRLNGEAYEAVERISPFGSDACFAAVGVNWAQSNWSQKLLELLPNPARWFVRSNNESVEGTPRLEFSSFHTDGVWKSESEINAIDVRAWAWISQYVGNGNPATDYAPEYRQMMYDKYHVLWNAFAETMGGAWAESFMGIVGYGGTGSTYAHDGASRQIYLGYPGSSPRPKWLTADEYEATINETQNGTTNNVNELWAENSIAIGSDSMPRDMVYAGYAQTGANHTYFVDPPSFAGFHTYIAWRLRSSGKEVRATYWNGASTPPTRRIIPPPDPEDPDDPDEPANKVVALGRPDLVTVTIADYEMAVMHAFRDVNKDPVLRYFWDNATTISKLTSSDNTTGVTRVYAVEVAVEGDDRSLLVVYTPCNLLALHVDAYTLPCKRLAYYIIDNAAETPVPQEVKVLKMPWFIEPYKMAGDVLVDSLEVTGDITVGGLATFGDVHQNGNSGAAIQIDWSNGPRQALTLTANCDITFTDPPGSCSLTLYVTQDGTGEWEITLPEVVKYVGGSQPESTPDANAVDVWMFSYDGANYMAARNPNIG